jgi:RNA polymerase sigma factor (sigma-70 family)
MRLNLGKDTQKYYYYQQVLSTFEMQKITQPTDNISNNMQPMEEPPMSREEEERLIEGLKKEQPWAYKQLYRACYRMVAAYVTRNSGSNDDARDLFQEVLLILVDKVRKPGFELKEGAKLSTFLFSIARNIWLMELRKRKKMPTVEPDPEMGLENIPDDASDHEFGDMKALVVSRLFEKIAEDCYRLLLAFYYKKTPLIEIAENMNYTEKFVRVKKTRCMNALREMINKDPDYNNLKESFDE